MYVRHPFIYLVAVISLFYHQRLVETWNRRVYAEEINIIDMDAFPTTMPIHEPGYEVINLDNLKPDDPYQDHYATLPETDIENIRKILQNEIQNPGYVYGTIAWAPWYKFSTDIAFDRVVDEWTDTFGWDTVDRPKSPSDIVANLKNLPDRSTKLFLFTVHGKPGELDYEEAPVTMELGFDAAFAYEIKRACHPEGCYTIFVSCLTAVQPAFLAHYANESGVPTCGFLEAPRVVDALFILSGIHPDYPVSTSPLENNKMLCIRPNGEIMGTFKIGQDNIDHINLIDK
jgi:hypothetical protein